MDFITKLWVVSSSFTSVSVLDLICFMASRVERYVSACIFYPLFGNLVEFDDVFVAGIFQCIPKSQLTLHESGGYVDEIQTVSTLG